MPLHGRADAGVAAVNTYRLTCELLTPLPIADVFRVFEDAGNLSRITPPSLGFSIVTPRPIHMRAGTEIDYSIRWLGFGMKWKTIITAYDAPHSFVDEQASGPYRLWRHRHSFRETPEGTLVADQVDYRLPFGPLGVLAHTLAVRRQLLRIFRYRQDAMPQLLGAPCRQLRLPAITAL